MVSTCATTELTSKYKTRSTPRRAPCPRSAGTAASAKTPPGLRFVFTGRILDHDLQPPGISWPEPHRRRRYRGRRHLRRVPDGLRIVFVEQDEQQPEHGCRCRQGLPP